MQAIGDTFDATKGYKRIGFREDRDLLDTELNELQEIVIHERDALVGRLYAPGSILDGLVATGNGTALVLTDGTVAMDGHAVAVPGATLTCAAQGVQTIWVDVFRRLITAAEDPSLVNPLTGEPTAEREQWIATLQTRDTCNDPLPEGATGRTTVALLTYDLATGDIVRVAPRPLAPGDAPRLDAVEDAAATLAAQQTAHLGAGGSAHALATPAQAGFMSPGDKAVLNGLAPQLAPTGAITAFVGRTPPAGWLECDGALVSRAAYPALCAAMREAQVVDLAVLNPGGFMHVLWPAHGLAMGARLTVSIAPGGTLPPGLAADTVYQISHQPGYSADAFCLSAVETSLYVLYTAPGVGALTATAYPFGAGDGSTTFNLPDLRGEFIRGWDRGRGVDADRSQGSAQAEAVGPHEHPITGDTSGGDDPWGGIERKVCTDDGGVAEGTPSGTLAHLQAANPVGSETRPRNVALLYTIKT